jgi:dethiobiotin synthetase
VRGVFVTGTDTEAGKTIVASAIAATLAASGDRVAAFKPAVTGLNDFADVAPDHELLRTSARSSQAPEAVAPYRFGPPASPHLAAHMAGVEIAPGHLIAAAEAAAAHADALVVEGVGGFLVPLSSDYLVRDFAAELGLPIVIATRPGLGTINHTLLTLECARAAGLDVVAVVLTPWPRFPHEIETSNRQTIERLGDVETFGLQFLDPDSRTSAVPGLPIRRWVPRETRSASYV